jgi:GDP-L-fucose synthase
MSKLLPALIRRFHDAKHRGDKTMTVWGTGTPRREFLHVDDLADAIVYLLRNYDAEEIVNIGWGEDISIRALAELVMSVIGYSGELVFDLSKPDGTPRKLLDVSRLNSLGWHPKIRLEDGIRETYKWFLQHAADARL